MHIPNSHNSTLTNGTTMQTNVLVLQWYSICGILIPSIEKEGYIMEKTIDKYLNNLDVEVAYLKYVAEQLKLLNEELKETERGVKDESSATSR
jgi:hypothetical protein